MRNPEVSETLGDFASCTNSALSMNFRSAPGPDLANPLPRSSELNRLLCNLLQGIGETAPREDIHRW